MLPIEGYEVSGPIGRGGSAIVYRGVQAGTGRAVAVKVMAIPWDETAAMRVTRERLALEALAGHANIVVALASGTLPDGRPYMVMDEMLGGSLADQGRTLGWHEVALLGAKIADALDAAHSAGVLHRDVKPQNILFDSGGEPHLSDFGLARVAGGPQTQTGLVHASLPHAAPEVFEGHPPSGQSDVYALGSTLHEVLAGAPPFGLAKGEPVAALFARISFAAPPDLRQHGVPDELASCVEKAMAKEPSQRFASAAAFACALRAAGERGARAAAPAAGPTA